MSPVTVKCPGCGRNIEWTAANKWRPFCSERCKMVDLGAWLREEHAIPGEPALDVAADGEPGEARH